MCEYLARAGDFLESNIQKWIEFLMSFRLHKTKE